MTRIAEVAAALALLAAGCGAGAAPAPGDPAADDGTLSYAELEGFTSYPVYALGFAYEGVEHQAVLHQLSSHYTEGYVSDSVTVIYGDCETGGQSLGGCALPQIQTWPACIRQPLRPQAVVRGVPAGFEEAGGRLELATGEVTVVVFGAGKAGVLRAAEALVLVNGAEFPAAAREPGADLPPPVPGAEDGSLSCGPPPVNVAPPTIAGEAVVGETLVAEPGEWDAEPPVVFSYRWRRCKDVCRDIGRGLERRYRVSERDAGFTLRVVERAITKGGGVDAASAQTSVVP